MNGPDWSIQQYDFKSRFKSQAVKRHARTGVIQTINVNMILKQQFPVRETAKTMLLRPKTANLSNLAISPGEILS